MNFLFNPHKFHVFFSLISLSSMSRDAKTDETFLKKAETQCERRSLVHRNSDLCPFFFLSYCHSNHVAWWGQNECVLQCTAPSSELLQQCRVDILVFFGLWSLLEALHGLENNLQLAFLLQSYSLDDISIRRYLGRAESSSHTDADRALLRPGDEWALSMQLSRLDHARREKWNHIVQHAANNEGPEHNCRHHIAIVVGLPVSSLYDEQSSPTHKPRKMPWTCWFDQNFRTQIPLVCVKGISGPGCPPAAERWDTRGRAYLAHRFAHDENAHSKHGEVRPDPDVVVVTDAVWSCSRCQTLEPCCVGRKQVSDPTSVQQTIALSHARIKRFDAGADVMIRILTRTLLCSKYPWIYAAVTISVLVSLGLFFLSIAKLCCGYGNCCYGPTEPHNGYGERRRWSAMYACMREWLCESMYICMLHVFYHVRSTSVKVSCVFSVMYVSCMHVRVQTHTNPASKAWATCICTHCITAWPPRSLLSFYKLFELESHLHAHAHIVHMCLCLCV